MTWRGLSPAPAALLIAPDARPAPGGGTTGAVRPEQAARRGAEARGLGPFRATPEHEAWRIARREALRRQARAPATLHCRVR